MLAAAAAVSLLPLAGCGGSATPSRPAAAATSSPVVPAKATLQIRIPTPSGPSALRRPRFVGAAVQGVSVAFYLHSDTGHTNQIGGGIFDVSASSNLCTPATGVRVCTLAITTQTGTEDVVVATYTEPPVSSTFSGAQELGIATIYGVQILANSANMVNVAVGGLIASMTLLPASQPLAGGTAANYPLDLTAYDAAGEVIIAGSSTVLNGGTAQTDTYANPVTITVHETGGSGHTTLSLNGGAHTTSVVVQTSSSTITVYYDGAASAGYSAAFAATATGSTGTNATLSLNFGAAIYVANSDGTDILGFPPVSPACTTSAPCTLGAAPVETVNTSAIPTGVALDGAGKIYVVNYYPSNIESVYAANANGTPTALETLTGMTDPEFIAVDPSGRIYVSSYAMGQVNVYPAASASCTPASPCSVSTPLATVANSGAWSVTIDASGRLYLADRGQGLIDVFPAIPTTCTTSAPCSITASLATYGTAGVVAVGGVAVDATGRVYMPSARLPGLIVYPAVSASCTTGNPCSFTTPLATITTSSGGATALDASGNIYQTSVSNAIQVYPPVAATCTTTAPCTFTDTALATITGVDTGLNLPQGLTIR